MLLGELERSDRIERFFARAEQAAAERAEIEDEQASAAETNFENDELDGLF